MLRRCTTAFRSVTLDQRSCQARHICAKTRLNARAKAEGESDGVNDGVDPPKRKRGRPRKNGTSAIEINANNTSSAIAAAKKKPKASETKQAGASPKSTSKPMKLPPRLVQPSPNHHDLESFLAYADRVNLNRATNVYKGTLYEYTVASVLSRLNFSLHRTGRSNDLGIDLVGHFHLPTSTRAETTSSSRKGQLELKVLVQCKALKPTPSMLRELEGAYAGAPAGWRSEDVLALLVASKEATRGVRDALQRSRWPMGLVQVTAEGEVRQFLWNAVAEEIGLAGLGVAVKHSGALQDGGKGEEKVKSTIVLTWLGKLWKSADAAK